MERFSFIANVIESKRRKAERGEKSWKLFIVAFDTPHKKCVRESHGFCELLKVRSGEEFYRVAIIDDELLMVPHDGFPRRGTLEKATFRIIRPAEALHAQTPFG